MIGIIVVVLIGKFGVRFIKFFEKIRYKIGSGLVQSNKRIACLVLQGRTYASVAIEYGISRERVYQITKRVCRLFAPEFTVDRYSIRELRKNCDRLIGKINGSNDAE